MFPSSLFNAELTGKLTAEESAELAANVAALTAAGLPLEAGLETLAEEIPGRRLSAVLRQLAAQLSAGVPLEKAIESQGRRFPAHLRGLIVAGVRSGQLAEIMDEYVAIARRQQETRHRIALSLAYPGLLLVAMAAVMIFFQVCVAPGLASILVPLERSGDRVAPLTQVFLGTCQEMAWGLPAIVIAAGVLCALVYWAPANVWVSSLVGMVPIVGAIRRYSGLAQLSRLAAMFLEQQVPLPQALRLTAAGLGHAELTAGCRQVAAEVEAGGPLDEALTANRQFPPGMAALVGWGQRGGSIPDSLGAVAETYDARSQSQYLLLTMIVPPIMFLGIAAMATFAFVALTMPMAALLRMFWW